MINTPEQANEYIEKVNNALMYLGELSADAGMLRHAAVFHTVLGSFLAGMDEFKILTDIIGKYNADVLNRLMP